LPAPAVNPPKTHNPPYISFIGVADNDIYTILQMKLPDFIWDRRGTAAQTDDLLVRIGVIWLIKQTLS
jgi:hypothetical protein